MRKAQYYLKDEFIKLHKNSRLYHLPCPIIAITGGIACGKSEILKKLSNLGFHVMSADNLVKNIYETLEAKDFLAATFPGIDFSVIRKLFFLDSKVKEKIENFIYPRLESAANDYLENLGKVDFIFFEIPLLFEKNLENEVDVIVCAYCSPETQMKRLQERHPVHSIQDQAFIDSLLSAQISLKDKAECADFCISTESEIALEGLLNNLLTNFC